MLDTTKGENPPGSRQLLAKLKGVAGFTGSGSFRYALSPAGSSNYEATLTGVAGLRCELFVEGEFIAQLSCRDGKVSARFDSRLGEPAIRLKKGDLVEIRQNGDVILEGALMSPGDFGRPKRVQLQRRANRRTLHASHEPRAQEETMKKLVAEFIGTFALVFFGCGAAVLAGAGTVGLGPVGQLGVSFAFGLAIVAMAYGIGPVSGCHVNPAVSFGAFVAGRMSVRDMALYWAAQFAGALAGAGVLLVIASGSADYSLAAGGLGANGWGEGYLGEYSTMAAFLFEVVATFLFLVVILGATQASAPSAMAGLAIGLTLAVIHIVGIQITGVSVNPARSFGPAVLVGGSSLAQLWLFFVAPLIGAALAGALFRTKMLVA